MQWYIPITILPGIGLVILSASNFVISLNDELERHHCDNQISEEIVLLKMKQLKRISMAVATGYSSAFLMVISGVILGLGNRWFDVSVLAEIIMLLAVAIFSVSLFLLSEYALKSTSIRQMHLRKNQNINKQE